MGVKSFKPTNITEGVHLGQGLLLSEHEGQREG